MFLSDISVRCTSEVLAFIISYKYFGALHLSNVTDSALTLIVNPKTSRQPDHTLIRPEIKQAAQSQGW